MLEFNIPKTDFVSQYNLKLASPTDIDGIKSHIEDLITKYKKIEPINLDKWVAGWQENLDLLIYTRNIESLIPKYALKQRFIRVNGEYFHNENDTLTKIHKQILTFLLKNLQNIDFSKIIEIGSGSCQNIPIIHEIFPSTQIICADWSPSSISIANTLSLLLSPNITGIHYDYFSDNTLDMSGSLVVTSHSLEQIGINKKPLDQILNSKPKMVLNIEPIVENYDPKSKLGNLLIEYHDVKGYLRGYPTYLSQKESEEKIRILQKGEIKFGSEVGEGYSYYLWEPLV